MIEVRVPATSANMGAGFDTLGIALSLYNTIQISETDNDFLVTTKNTDGYTSTGKNNLIYRSMEKVFQKAGYTPKGIHISQDSQIPMTRGLGSSAACIVGGMLAANVLAGRPFSYPELLDMAVEMEGHPDNVTPALYGGFCVSSVKDGKTTAQSFKIEKDIKFAVMIPEFFVQTRKSRGALPEQVAFRDAVFNISRVSTFIAAMVSGNLDALSVGVEDVLHQPYRKNHIDHMEAIFEKSYQQGAKGTYLSGSGPTILSIVSGTDATKFCDEMNRFFAGLSEPWKCRILSIDNVGTVLKVSDGQ